MPDVWDTLICTLRSLTDTHTVIKYDTGFKGTFHISNSFRIPLPPDETPTVEVVKVISINYLYGVLL